MMIFSNPFLVMALWAGLLASIASGVIGSYVVVRRISFIAGSIAHSVLGGMGFALWAGFSPLLGAFAAAIISALLLGYVQLRFKQREDALIAAIWSTGMAVGVIFIALTPNSTSALMDFLFGNILYVTPTDLWALFALDIVVLGLVAYNYKSFLALCFDEKQAVIQKVPVQRLYMLLLCLVAISIVLLIQIIGTILVLALLTIPATIAALYTSRLITMMLFAVAAGAFFNLFGLELSYQLNWPPGATIALLAAFGYLATLAFKRKQLVN